MIWKTFQSIIFWKKNFFSVEISAVFFCIKKVHFFRWKPPKKFQNYFFFQSCRTFYLLHIFSWDRSMMSSTSQSFIFWKKNYQISNLNFFFFYFFLIFSKIFTVFHFSANFKKKFFEMTFWFCRKGSTVPMMTLRLSKLFSWVRRTFSEKKSWPIAFPAILKNNHFWAFFMIFWY